MAKTRESTSGVVQVNGADIYYEIRGAGPTLLLIAPGGGDGGVFDRVADDLADEFTVVTYDRRGNSRSPRPRGWSRTTVEEQADDAAGLLQTMGLAPAAVFGTSLSAIIALDLAIRHPTRVRGAIIHESGLFSVLQNPREVMAAGQAMIQRGLETGGPAGGLAAALRLSYGDRTYEAIDQKVRDRLQGNGEVFLNIERSLMSYRPSEAGLASVKIPVYVLIASEGPGSRAPAPFFGEVAKWLASRLNTRPGAVPGTHGDYLDHPERFAGALRSMLQGMTGGGSGVPQ